MSAFRYLADILHLLSFLVLIYHIRKNKNCRGISCKTQEVYLIVFVARYLDLFWSFVSFYNTMMKIFFVFGTAYIIYIMRFKSPYKSTYIPEQDNFEYWLYLIPPCFVLGLIFNDGFELGEILWSFSIFLEAVAYIPQLQILRKMGEVEIMTSHYVFCLGGYRFMYILHWIYRISNGLSISWISMVCGLMQTVLYADFLYYYVKARIERKGKVILPI